MGEIPRGTTLTEQEWVWGYNKEKIVGMASKLGEEMKERFVDNILTNCWSLFSSSQLNSVIRLTIYESFHPLNLSFNSWYFFGMG